MCGERIQWRSALLGLLLCNAIRPVFRLRFPLGTVAFKHSGVTEIRFYVSERCIRFLGSDDVFLFVAALHPGLEGKHLQLANIWTQSTAHVLPLTFHT